MTPTLEAYLAKADSLAKLEPKHMPKHILVEFTKLDAPALYKTCTQFAILRHNIPQKEAVLTLEEEEVVLLAQTYAKEIIAVLKSYAN
ncbi:MAG: hypothetical protein IBX45_04660 [Campylobacterales bacterium]|nr:hypothetical protein [Campylobacterales bacterium]